MKTKTNAPLPIKVETDQKYSWCSCGFSKTMPLCDNSHRELSHCIYVAVQKQSLRLTVTIVIIAREVDGY